MKSLLFDLQKVSQLVLTAVMNLILTSCDLAAVRARRPGLEKAKAFGLRSVAKSARRCTTRGSFGAGTYHQRPASFSPLTSCEACAPGRPCWAIVVLGGQARCVLLWREVEWLATLAQGHGDRDYERGCKISSRKSVIDKWLPVDRGGDPHRVPAKAVVGGAMGFLDNPSPKSRFFSNLCSKSRIDDRLILIEGLLSHRWRTCL